MEVNESSAQDWRLFRLSSIRERAGVAYSPPQLLTLSTDVALHCVCWVAHTDSHYQSIRLEKVEERRSLSLLPLTQGKCFLTSG